MRFRDCLTLTLGIILSSNACDVTAQVYLERVQDDPVLPVGEAGAWDEGLAVGTSVLFENGVFKMWYEAPTGFGYATSPDGIVWIKHPAGRVLAPGPDNWDAIEINHPSVVAVGQQYYMWYSAPSPLMDNRIGLATSPDGIVWTKHPQNPVLTPGQLGDWDSAEVMHPTVILDDGVFRMWYNGHNQLTQRILYAESSDGIDWTRFLAYPMLSPGLPGEWDDFELGPMTVLPVYDRYYMWYTGWNQQGEFRIGFASSLDGLTWIKANNVNPVLSPDLAGAWDDNMVVACCALPRFTDYLLWYAGSDGITFQTGLAMAPGESAAPDPTPAAAVTLLEPHPNPFNPQTVLSFNLMQASPVELSVFTLKGECVRTLIDDALKAGTHEFIWDGRDHNSYPQASGVYLIRLKTPETTLSQEVVLIR